MAREAGFDSIGHGIYLDRPLVGQKTPEDEDIRKHPTRAFPVACGTGSVTLFAYNAA